MDQTRKILVVGTGAAGSLYGGYLAKAGASVSVLSRSDYRRVKEKGIEIKSILGDYHFMPDQVVKSAADYKDTPDYILVATKVLPDLDIHGIIKSAVAPDTSILLLQNGIDIEKDVAASFPDNEIISALAFICVSRPEYGKIEHTDFGSITIGRYPEGPSSKVNELRDLFNASGIKCAIDENITTSRWKKLVWNAPFNPLSVLGGGLDTREMAESDEAMTLARKVMGEIIELARREGHPLPERIIENNIESTKKMVPFKTSMLQDFEKGKPVESEAILGNALRLGKKHDFAMPATETIYQLLTLADKKNRSVKKKTY
jgi:2-dehydropantoate 2-reductase